MIVVTGSEGFLGKHLVKRLEAEGHDVIMCDRLLGSRLQDVPYREIKQPVEAIVHLAADTQVGWCWQHPAECLDNNVGATLAALRIARHFDCPIIISTSDKVYPGGNVPHHEDSNLGGYCPYSQSKVICDDLARAYDHYAHHGMVYVVRFGNLIGHDDHNAERLFPAIRRAVVDHDPIPFVHRRFRRCWLDVEDAVDGILAILQRAGTMVLQNNPSQHRVFNMAGVLHSVGEVLDEFQWQLERELPAEANTPDYYELPDLLVNSNLARSVLGWSPKRSLTDTVAECLREWGDR